MGSFDGSISTEGLQVKFTNGDEPTVEITSAKAFEPTQIKLDTAKPSEQVSSEPRTDVTSQVEKAAQSHKDAETQGVNIKKKAFIKNLALAIGSGVAVGVTLLTTIGTGGATAPLLFLATTHLGVAVGDSICSYMDWKGKRSDLLPMGQDSVGNMAFAALKKLGYQDGKAFKFADRISIATRGLLAFATLSSNETIREKAPAVLKNAAKQGYYSAKESYIKQQDALATPVTLSQLPEIDESDDELSSAGEATPLLKTSKRALHQLSEIEQKQQQAEQALKQKLQQVSDRRLQWSQQHSGTVQFHAENDQVSFHDAQATDDSQQDIKAEHSDTDRAAAIARLKRSPEYQGIQTEIANLRTELDLRGEAKVKRLKQMAKQLKHSPAMRRTELVTNKKGVETLKVVGPTQSQIQAELSKEEMYIDRQMEKLRIELEDKREQGTQWMSSALDLLDLEDESLQDFQATTRGLNAIY
ncbi:hypothetical protein [Parashewanella tropica]|uniref:hypothetical protein n=1 Tax=Parashewanella tropica TaxID=2547970 RepID=UPI00105A8C54|nr:hypothetical protein [Parashewanella tropica]